MNLIILSSNPYKSIFYNVLEKKKTMVGTIYQPFIHVGLSAGLAVGGGGGGSMGLIQDDTSRP